jgi:hypothetical protein
MRSFLLLSMICLVVSGCNQGDISSSNCLEYGSKYSCDYVKNQAIYNVLFYFPPNGSNSKEYHLGAVKGLEQCQSLARSYATQKSGGSTKYGWSYICCLKTKDSYCEEKHR